VLIDGRILAYDFDSTLVITAQRPRDSIAGIGIMTKDK